MNPDLRMAGELKNTGAGNLFVVFGEPDIRIEPVMGHDADEQVRVRVKGVDVFRPQTGEIESGGTDSIALWMIDTAYNEESFFVRQAYFLGAADPYKALKTTLKAEIDAEAWATLNSDVSRPFAKPKTGRIAVKVINHLGDEVMNNVADALERTPALRLALIDLIRLLGERQDLAAILSAEKTDSKADAPAVD